MLLKLGLDRFATLFVYAQPFRYNEANAVAIHEFTQLFETVAYRIPILFLLCLFEQMKRMQALLKERESKEDTETNALEATAEESGERTLGERTIVEDLRI
jgi:hypothetical protein